MLVDEECQTAQGAPTVLFLCVHNAGRSQMALGVRIEEADVVVAMGCDLLHQLAPRT